MPSGSVDYNKFRLHVPEGRAAPQKACTDLPQKLTISQKVVVGTVVGTQVCHNIGISVTVTAVPYHTLPIHIARRLHARYFTETYTA